MPVIHLPVVVPCPVTDNLCEPIAQMSSLSSEARAALSSHNFLVIAELAMCPPDRAIKLFGEGVAKEIQAALASTGYCFGSMPSVPEFLRPLSSFNGANEWSAMLTALTQIKDCDPSALATVFLGQIPMPPLFTARANVALHSTGLELYMRLSDIFVEALNKDEVAFYLRSVTELGLSEEVLNLILNCGVTEVHELYLLARTPGFPCLGEVEAAFSAHGHTLHFELQFDHFKQIYGIT